MAVDLPRASPSAKQKPDSRVGSVFAPPSAVAVSQGDADDNARPVHRRHRARLSSGRLLRRDDRGAFGGHQRGGRPHAASLPLLPPPLRLHRPPPPPSAAAAPTPRETAPPTATPVTPATPEPPSSTRNWTGIA